jgi:hypothetical protein
MEKALGMFTVLLVALAMTGVAVSRWTDNVKIEGTVHMGELIVGFLDNSVTWYETTNGVPETEFDHPKPWVCDATVQLSDFRTSVHHVPPVTVGHKMTIDINNAYPQWDLHIDFVLKNAGTIPATLVDCMGEGRDVTDEEDLILTDDWKWDATLGAWVIDGEVWDESGHLIMNLHVEAHVPEDLQLEPCNNYPVHIDLDFKQTAEECHTYTFWAEFVFVQWNKAWEFGHDAD